MDHIAHQAPLSKGCSRQEHWSGLPCPPPGDVPNPGVKHLSLMSPTLADGFFITITTWVHVSTGEESSGSGPDSTQGLRPRHRGEEESREAPEQLEWGLASPEEPTFSLSSFTFIKRLFSSSSLSSIRVVSSAYLRFLIFLPAILIPACASSSPAVSHDVLCI